MHIKFLPVPRKLAYNCFIFYSTFFEVHAFLWPIITLMWMLWICLFYGHIFCLLAFGSLVFGILALAYRYSIGICYWHIGILALGIWHLAFGIWHLGFAIWHSLASSM